ncbi:spore gernimation protein [Brevibacillus parabrevis]|uniref:GerAB/ArcD/ProY family transporter n=1 Tax=Brevibacillus parabrevis TaxID=54914 RepID=UPI0007AB5C89|nr:endospore germination permease [Brevibacillus parabrevis]KZE54715.1 spore gernimation protein [Brevibacillus parabrevis]
MENQRGNISTWQLIAILISSMIGVGILTLPRTATTQMQEMGWLGPLIGGLIAVIPLMSIIYLSKQYPGLTFVEYAPLIFGGKRHQTWGKILHFPWILAYLLFQFLNTGMVARGFGEVIVTTVLLDTPLEVIVLTLFMIVLYLCMHEFEVLVRVNELLFPIMFVPILIIPYVTINSASWYNLLPLHIDSWQGTAETAIGTFTMYTGFELMMIYFGLAMPGARIALATWGGFSFTVVSYVLTVAAGIVVFGYEELQHLIWPTLEMVKTAQRTGWFLERMESAFLTIWMASVFTTFGNMYYTMIYATRLWLKKGIRFQRIAALVFIIPLFYVSLWPQNIVEFFAYAKKLTYFSYLPTVLFPILLAVIQWFRARGSHAVADAKKGGT